MLVPVRNRGETLKKSEQSPFPYLIKPVNVKGSAALSFKNSRNMLISGCTTENAFSLELGEDSTIILYNHTQIYQSKGEGTKKYTIPLAYIISFGKEIRQSSAVDFLEDLIAYSTKQWKLEYGKPV